MTITFYDCGHPLSAELQGRITGFLFRHLGRFGDPCGDIRRAIDYAMKADPYAGGFVCVASESEEITGAVVMNRTGMESYIPENILVYIAVHEAHRGQGLGKRLMKAVIEHAEGGIALHVDPNNPARRLYESLGFTNKYLEMRLQGKEGS